MTAEAPADRWLELTVTCDGEAVEPYHDRIREAIAASLDEPTSRRVHVGLAQAIESWDRDRADMLARYWLAAADRERAKHYACEAATEARAKLAFDRAADCGASTTSSAFPCRTTSE